MIEEKMKQELRKWSFKQIKEYLEREDFTAQEKNAYGVFLAEDPRKAVASYGLKLQKNYEKHLAEIMRTEKMKWYEKGLYEKGFSLLAGIDEVGRGPLAGPVVAAAVILPKNFFVLGINDSKQLSEEKREDLYKEITSKAFAWSIGMVDHEEIDRINILNATKTAMKKAVLGLRIPPDHLIIDALLLKDISLPQLSLVKGDEKSVSIAAASIVAKVSRDHLMQKYHEEYPGYGFDQNKGYGTKAHYEGIHQHGISAIHRKTFLKGVV